MCSCVWRGLEALAELYINTFVKWAGVVEYLCVSVCVFLGACYLRFSHHEAQKPHAAALYVTHFAFPSLSLFFLFTYASSTHSFLSLCLSCSIVFFWDDISYSLCP